MLPLLSDIIRDTQVLQSQEKEQFIAVISNLPLTQQEELHEIFKKNPENIKLLYENFSQKITHIKNKEQWEMVLEEEIVLLDNADLNADSR